MEKKKFEEICKIYSSDNINLSLAKGLIANINNINKKYFLSFLIDENIPNNEISKYEDFWFMKNKPKNLEMVKKYIDLSIDYIKSQKNVNTIQFCCSFLETNLEKKIIFMYLILDKYGLCDNIIYLFLGFIIGENENFIKQKYVQNLESLLRSANIRYNIITEDMPIYEINEKILETFNLCLYLKEKFRSKNIEEYEIDSNDLEENEEESEEKEEEEEQKNDNYINKKDMLFLIKSLFDKKTFEKLDLNVLYKKLISSNDFHRIFSFIFDEKEKTNEFILFQKKINQIKNNIFEILNNNKDEYYDNNKIEKRILLNKNNLNTKIEQSLNINNYILNKDLQPNENWNNTIINNNINDGKANEINCLKNKNHNFNNENDSNSFESTSYGSEKLSSMIKIENLSGFDCYPNLKLLEKGQKKDLSKQFVFDVFKVGQMSYFIQEKINSIYNLIDSSILKFENKEKQTCLDTDIIKLKLLNSRLEVLITFLNNPNLILLKRKIIETLIFEIFQLYKDKFSVPKKYMPKMTNLIELQNLMNNFKIKNPEDKEVKNDIENLNKIIIEMKTKKFDLNSESDEKDDDKNENNLYDDIWQVKDFLHFYKEKLNKFVHINSDKEKYFFIPELFNTEVKEVKFMKDIGLFSNTYNKTKENKDDNQIIKEEEIINRDIYKKYLQIDNAIDIIFSNGSRFNYITDNFIKELYKIRNYDKSDNVKNIFYSIFDLKKNGNTLTRSINNNEIITSAEKEFYNDIIINFEKYYDYLISKETFNEDDKNIIKKINNYILHYIESCNSQANNWINIFTEYDNNAFIYYEIIIRNLENIENLLKKTASKMFDHYIQQKNYYFKKLEEIELKIKKIKKFVKEQYNPKDFDFYKIWKKSKKTKLTKVKTLKEIKQILKKNFLAIKIDINYIYDENFCLWVINKNFQRYFY